MKDPEVRALLKPKFQSIVSHDRVKYKLTSEISLSLVLPIMLPTRRVIPLNPKPFFLGSFDRTDISNSTKRGFERDSLIYMII